MLVQGIKTQYEVWMLGYNEDDTVNDFDQLEGSFDDEDKAVWFATHYEFSKPSITPKAKIVVEEVQYDTERGDCVSVVLETEI